MLYFWWGCKGNLKLVTLALRVKRLSCTCLLTRLVNCACPKRKFTVTCIFDSFPLAFILVRCIEVYSVSARYLAIFVLGAEHFLQLNDVAIQAAGNVTWIVYNVPFTERTVFLLQTSERFSLWAPPPSGRRSTNLWQRPTMKGKRRSHWFLARGRRSVRCTRLRGSLIFY